MNKKELVAVVADQLGKTQADVNVTLNAIIDTIGTVLSNGEKVVITGFGTYEVRDRAERNGKDPRTGRVITVPRQKTPAFRAGKILKSKVK